MCESRGWDPGWGVGGGGGRGEGGRGGGGGHIATADVKDPFECEFENIFLFIEPAHEISNNVVCATSKGSDQPAHTHRLMRAFASSLTIL